MPEALTHGTTPWFEMVGAAIIDAAEQVGLPPELHLSFVERYVDGVMMPNGLCQGLRIDIDRGSLSFRAGVLPDEKADVVIEVTTATARQLNLLHSADPAYARAVAQAIKNGSLRSWGDLGALGQVFALAHDRVVAGSR